MVSTDKESVGGMLVSMTLRPRHTLLEAQSVDTVYSALQQYCLQFNAGRHITEESIQAFNAGRLDKFPELKRVSSLVRNVGQDVGVVIIGDSAQLLSSDGVKGLNSALENLKELVAAQSSAPQRASLRDAISSFINEWNIKLSMAVIHLFPFFSQLYSSLLQ